MKLKNLKTKFLGINSFYYDEIDSTQKEIWRRINEIQNGTLIMAGVQSFGIGTHGRKWYTDTENNIAFSVYIDLNCNISKLQGLTLEIAEILVDIFYRFYNIKLNIKKPNDIYYNNKKIGGILTESKVFKEQVKYIVIGIGINITDTEFNEEIKTIASSIEKEFNVKVNCEDVITEFCNCFEEKIMKRIGKE